MHFTLARVQASSKCHPTVLLHVKLAQRFTRSLHEVCCRVDSHRIWTLRPTDWTSSHDLSDLSDCHDFLGDCRAFHGAGARGWGGTSINLVCWGAPCPAERWWPVVTYPLNRHRGNSRHVLRLRKAPSPRGNPWGPADAAEFGRRNGGDYRANWDTFLSLPYHITY